MDVSVEVLAKIGLQIEVADHQIQHSGRKVEGEPKEKKVQCYQCKV